MLNSSDEMVRDGVGRGACARAEAEFVENVCDVAVHRVLAEHELRSDFGVGSTRGDQAKHLSLPAGERRRPNGHGQAQSHALHVRGRAEVLEGEQRGTELLAGSGPVAGVAQTLSEDDPRLRGLISQPCEGETLHRFLAVGDRGAAADFGSRRRREREERVGADQRSRCRKLGRETLGRIGSSCRHRRRHRRGQHARSGETVRLRDAVEQTTDQRPGQLRS